jgi:hypothetical protein
MATRPNNHAGSQTTLSIGTPAGGARLWITGAISAALRPRATSPDARIVLHDDEGA